MSASDIAALRIREARRRKKWRVKDLAAACEEAKIPGLTAAVITNLETRRRPERQISAEELLGLAWVLDVPPILLLTPLNGDEELQIAPGAAKDPIDAVAWLADDDAMLGAVPPAADDAAENTERVLRHRDSALTIMRQLRVVARRIRFHDQMITDADWRKQIPEPVTFDQNSLTVMAIRLLHLIDSLEALGYSRPPLDDVMEIIARHGFPATLAELDRGELNGAST